MGSSAESTSSKKEWFYFQEMIRGRKEKGKGKGKEKGEGEGEKGELGNIALNKLKFLEKGISFLFFLFLYLCFTFSISFAVGYLLFLR